MEIKKIPGSYLGTLRLQLPGELVDREARLFDQALQCAGLYGSVLWDDDSPVCLAKDGMGPSLANFNEPKPPQSPHRLGA
jgi:hypothetical protein